MQHVWTNCLFRFGLRIGSIRVWSLLTTTSAMPNQKILSTPYPLIDADPHATRVVRYFRTSDWATWAAGTAAFPASLALWGALPYSLLFTMKDLIVCPC